MSADKYAQFIAEQQRKLSVSGTNAVEVAEKKELSPKQKKIAAQAGDPEKIEGEDFAKLRAQKEEVEQVGEGVGVKNNVRKAILVGAKTSKGDVEHKINKDIITKLKGKEAGKTYDTARKLVAKEEVELISIEEQTYIEEMVGKGKLADILMHHKDNMRHHEKMMNHHAMMADKSEEVGDTDGFDHHVGMQMHHEYSRNHHQARYDHAAGLKARANAQREMKSAQTALDNASKKIAAAKQEKKDWYNK